MRAPLLIGILLLLISGIGNEPLTPEFVNGSLRLIAALFIMDVFEWAHGLRR